MKSNCASPAGRSFSILPWHEIKASILSHTFTYTESHPVNLLPDYIHSSRPYFRVAAHNRDASGKWTVNAKDDTLHPPRQDRQEGLCACLVTSVRKEWHKQIRHLIKLQMRHEARDQFNSEELLSFSTQGESFTSANWMLVNYPCWDNLESTAILDTLQVIFRVPLTYLTTILMG